MCRDIAESWREMVKGSPRSLLEPDVWTGTARPDASEQLKKKRAEILQMAVLEPSLCVLDETDSGLDIDALQVVSKGVNALRAEDRAILMVTHYQRLLNHIVPDHVHVLAGGRIVKSGGRELALELEERGYGWLGVKDEEATPSAAS